MAFISGYLISRQSTFQRSLDLRQQPGRLKRFFEDLVARVVEQRIQHLQRIVVVDRAHKGTHTVSYAFYDFLSLSNTKNSIIC